MKQTTRKRRPAARKTTSRKVRKSGKSRRRRIHDPDSRVRLYFSTGQAAHELRATQADIRSLCHSGLIEAKQTRKGHFRISPQEIQRLKIAGLPEMPSGEVQPPEPPRIPPRLFAPPSPELAAEADAAVTLENRVRRSKLRLEHEQVTDALEDHRRKKLALVAEKIRLRQERLDRQAREAWAEYWWAYGMELIPADVPAEYVRHADRLLRKTIQQHTESSDEYLKPIIAGAVETALKPWKKQVLVEEIIEKAAEQLPWPMHSFCGPTEWDVRVKALAAQRIRELSGDYSLQEARNEASQAVESLKTEYQRESDRQQVLQSVRYRLNGKNRIAKATVALEESLAALPAGSSKEKLEQARDAAIAPLLREQDAENRAAILATHVATYMNRLHGSGMLDFSETTSLSAKFRQELQVLIAARILRGEIAGMEDAHQLIESFIDDRLETTQRTGHCVRRCQ
jgi:hypothetical protein